jgi:DNA replication protein DnaC
LNSAKTLLERMHIAAKEAAERTDAAINAERELYRQLLKQRADELDQGGNETDFRMRMVKLGCPVRLVRALSTAKQTPAMQAAKQFVAEGSAKLFLVLLGPVGVGKSLAAAAVLADFVRQCPWGTTATGQERPPAMFVQASELTRVTAFGPEHGDWLKNMKFCELLVLDDAGDEATAPGRDALADILLTRERKHRPTVITANLRPEMVRGRYGDAIADRFREHALAPNLWGIKSMRGGGAA